MIPSAFVLDDFCRVSLQKRIQNMRAGNIENDNLYLLYFHSYGFDFTTLVVMPFTVGSVRGLNVTCVWHLVHVVALCLKSILIDLGFTYNAAYSQKPDYDS